MQAVAILLVASTMGGDYPTNSNNLALPPVLSSADSQSGNSYLDLALKATADTASESANAAGNRLRRAAASTRNGVRRAANNLSLGAPKTRVAQAQYQQGGVPKRPVDGMTGPGTGAAASDPTSYRGRRMQPVPPATGAGTATGYGSNTGYSNAPTGYGSTNTPSLTPPPTTSRNTGTPAYRPPGSASAVNTPNNTGNTSIYGTQFPLPAATATPPAAERNYTGVANDTNNGSTSRGTGLAPLNVRPFANDTAATGTTPNTIAKPNEAYRPPTTPAAIPYGTGGTEGYRSAASSNPGTSIVSTSGNRPGTITDTGNQNRFNGPGTNETLDNQRTGGSYFMTLLFLFASVGLNLYLGWIAWDTYNRYQDLVSDMRTTSSRRERRPERRRFTETSAAAY